MSLPNLSISKLISVISTSEDWLSVAPSLKLHSDSNARLTWNSRVIDVFNRLMATLMGASGSSLLTIFDELDGIGLGTVDSVGDETENGIFPWVGVILVLATLIVGVGGRLTLPQNLNRRGAPPRIDLELE